MYWKISKTYHKVEVTEEGLLINLQWSFIGASPDGIISFHYCIQDILEIKYPYCHWVEKVL